MERRKLLILAAVICAAALVHFFVIPLDKLIMLIFAEKSQCLPGDMECLERLKAVRGNCTPSVSIVTVGNETNNVTIRITTYPKGDKCVTEEEVIDDSNSGIAPFDITGYNISCEVDADKLEEFGQKACNGSLSSFVAPDDSSYGETTGDDDEYVFVAYCSLDADDCKEEASAHITTCMESEILMDQEINNTLGGTSYWSIFIKVEQLPVEYTETEKLQPRCSIYYELVNAVNLPPDLPPEMIGMNMTCVVPLSEFPIDWVVPRDCEGSLIDFLELLFP